MALLSASTEDSEVARRAVRRVVVRLVPFVALMFFINFLDRTAIGFAGPNGLNDDLMLSAAQFGFASGVFFVGYVLLEIPSNLALHKYGARRWLARIMASWGVVSLLFVWVQNYEQLLALRVLLGIAEAGFFPGAILFLSMWVPLEYRGRVLAFFYLAQPLTSVIGAPFASWLMEQGAAVGVDGWRFMFFGVSIPAIVVGIVAWFYLTDRPADAKWLRPDEREWLTEALTAERSRLDEQSSTHARPWRALGVGRVWMLAIAYFGLAYGLNALAFFLPTIIAGFQEQFGVEFSVLEIGFITAIPYVPAAIILLLWSAYATRHGVRVRHVAIPIAIAAISVPVALYTGSPAATVAVIAVTASGIFAAFPLFWTLPTRFLVGPAAAAGVALINSIGNLSGISSPYITGALADATGGYHASMFVVSGFMLIAVALLFMLSRQPWARGGYQGVGRPSA